jgi:hypothetical protein
LKSAAVTVALLFAQTAWSAVAGDWLLVEFSRSAPACEDVADNDRCWATRSDVASFEMRDGETLELPSDGILPPAWVRMRRLWVNTADFTAADQSFRITLDRTPIGARLQVIDGERSFLTSLPLNEWVRMDDRNQGEVIWTRVSGAAYP